MWSVRPVLVCAVFGVCGLAFLRSGVTGESARAATAEGPMVCPGEITRKAAAGHAAHGPWRTAVAVAAVPRRGVKVGEPVTVIPLRAGLPPVELKVTLVEEQEATDLKQATWLVEAETTADEILALKPDPGRSEEHPLEAVVVYPAQKRAHLLAAKDVGQDLPKERGCSSRTLFGAVDLDDDAHADAEIFRFCCERPKATWKSSAPTPCNSNCEAVYARSGAGPWKVVYEEGEN
jgi:hypothetical protein